MKNKSKSCFNFIRRELSESEKLLLNKYNEIEPEQNDVKIKDLKTLKNKNDLAIKEIENRLDNDYNKYNFNNKFNKTNIDNNNSIYKNSLYKTSKEIVNKYIKPQSQFLNNIDIDYSKLGKTYNKNNSVVNYNFINLTESLLNKTQNIILPAKTLEVKKTNLKNNSCKNIFCFKRIKEEEKDINKENNDIPKLFTNKNIIKDYSFKDFFNNGRKKLKISEKKFEYNLSDININKKKDYESIFKKRSNNNNKYLYNKNLSSTNIKVIKPYKYFSTNNNNKKAKNKISKNYSQTDININKNKVSRKINGYNYKNKNSLLQYSSIFSDLISKNKNYF